MLDSIKKGLKLQQEMQFLGFEELFGENTEEVVFVSNVVQVVSTIQWVYDWRKKGFKKATTNNAVIAVGLLGYYMVKIPAVERKIASTLERISDNIAS